MVDHEPHRIAWLEKEWNAFCQIQRQAGQGLSEAQAERMRRALTSPGGVWEHHFPHQIPTETKP
jgi:hypothetical protein